MFGGYISQGVLQSNQQKTVQSLPNRLGNIEKTPKDSVQFSAIDSNDMIFNVKKFGFKDDSDARLSVTAETASQVRPSPAGNVLIGSDEGLISEISNSPAGCNEGLTPGFLCGAHCELPSAEGAILTAQTIIEHDLVEKGKNKYTNLKECQASSKIISTVHGFDNTLSDIVVKNSPILLDF
jgi:hypothetical protein